MVVGFVEWFYSPSAAVHRVPQGDIFIWSFHPVKLSLLLVFSGFDDLYERRVIVTVRKIINLAAGL